MVEIKDTKKLLDRLAVNGSNLLARAKVLIKKGVRKLFKRSTLTIYVGQSACRTL
jgi:hypothetical protein